MEYADAFVRAFIPVFVGFASAILAIVVKNIERKGSENNWFPIILFDARMGIDTIYNLTNEYSQKYLTTTTMEDARKGRKFGPVICITRPDRRNINMCDWYVSNYDDVSTTKLIRPCDVNKIFSLIGGKNGTSTT